MTADGGVDALLGLAKDAAAQAGRLLVDRRSSLDRRRDVATKTTPTDVVTRLDVESEQLIRQVIQAARPGDQVVGEEGGSSGSSGAVRWVVDPLDGSVNYLFGIPAWSVSVAAEMDGRAVVGVVAVPELGRTYWATRQGGAFRDGVRLAASGQTELGLALVATGFAYDASRRSRQAAVLGRLLGRVRDVRRLGSAAWDLCLLAEGAVDAYYERGLNAWDYAAGALIATEAGADVTAADGLVAGAGAGLARPFRQLLAEVGA
jgi:myo-inositol-1(or 4)-monophosphatase